MPSILSVSSYSHSHEVNQDATSEFANELFSGSFLNIERLLPVFKNGQIEERQFAVPLKWFEEDHSLKERNDLYIELATKYSVEAIKRCLSHEFFLKEEIEPSEIDALI